MVGGGQRYFLMSEAEYRGRVSDQGNLCLFPLSKRALQGNGYIMHLDVE